MAKRESNPVVLAKRALSDALSRAIDTKNDERILATAKAVLSALARPEDSEADEEARHAAIDSEIRAMTDEERKEAIKLNIRIREIRQAARDRRDGKQQPIFASPPAPTPPKPAGPVLEEGEFIDENGKHWWRDPETGEILEYSEEPDDE